LNLPFNASRSPFLTSRSDCVVLTLNPLSFSSPYAIPALKRSLINSFLLIVSFRFSTALFTLFKYSISLFIFSNMVCFFATFFSRFFSIVAFLFSTISD